MSPDTIGDTLSFDMKHLKLFGVHYTLADVEAALDGMFTTQSYPSYPTICNQFVLTFTLSSHPGATHRSLTTLRTTGNRFCTSRTVSTTGCAPTSFRRSQHAAL
jgi:hypothetical protein